MTLVTRAMTAEGLSTSTFKRPRRSARVVPVIGGWGWVSLEAVVKALTLIVCSERDRIGPHNRRRGAFFD